jgi:hypothetical protein
MSYKILFSKKNVQMILKGWISGVNTPKIHPFLENKGGNPEKTKYFFY